MRLSIFGKVAQTTDFIVLNVGACIYIFIRGNESSINTCQNSTRIFKDLAISNTITATRTATMIALNDIAFALLNT